MLMPQTRLYAGISPHIPATVPSQKVNPAGPEDIPVGTYPLDSHSGISTRLPREAKSDSSHRNLKLPCHHEQSHDVTVHSDLLQAIMA
jgi:hypothetical protein